MSEGSSDRAGALPAAVLFDCDGTLQDSERVAVAAMRDALADQGHELLERDVARVVGHPWPRTSRLFVELYGMTDDDLERYLEAWRRTAGPLLEDPKLVFDDVVQVLDELAAAQVPMAVVTSSGRDHLARALRLAPLQDRFAVRIAREDVERHKPDPLPYTAALDELRRQTGLALPARDVAVVEDSVAGVAAGRAAGCWTVAVDRGADLHDLSEADLVVTELRTEHLIRP